ncbi:hypothetical protein [Thiofaba sp. EF100]|uniref:hypothetical protein n=1 Tax=Thiofaba sp. EF100 TaxID=3121274 RepID=UPI0032215745
MRQLRMPSVLETPPSSPPPESSVSRSASSAQNPAQDVIIGVFMTLADQVMDILGLDNFANSELMLRLRVKPRPDRQLEVRSESTATCEARL